MLQEARCFNDPHIDPRRCQQVHFSLLSPALLAPAAIEDRYTKCCTSWTNPCSTFIWCLQVITKLLYLICQGESLTKVRLGYSGLLVLLLASNAWLMLWCQTPPMCFWPSATA